MCDAHVKAESVMTVIVMVVCTGLLMDAMVVARLRCSLENQSPASFVPTHTTIITHIHDVHELIRSYVCVSVQATLVCPCMSVHVCTHAYTS